MTPSSASLPTQVLRSRLEEDGYLLLRGLLPREEVVRAREVIAEDLTSGGFVEEGLGKDDVGGALRIKRGTEDPGPKLLARQDLARRPEVLNVLEHPTLRALMVRLLGAYSSSSTSDDSREASIKTHPYKWLRAVSTTLHTGPHLDSTYFPLSQYPSLLTAWIPLGDLSPSLGTIAVATSPLSLPPVELGRDGTRSGWIEGVEGMETGWVTERVRMGDVVVIGRERVHCSSINLEGEWRLSCDTRWMGSKVEEGGEEKRDVLGEEESGSEEDGGSYEEDEGSSSEEEEDAAGAKGGN